MKNQFVLPNVMTTFGLACGLFVIFRMNMIAPGLVEIDHLRSSLMIMLLAAFIDTLDGALARAMKVESAFGGFFDSMSDAVVFGVAPSVLLLKAVSPETDSVLGLLVYGAAMAFSVAGVLRLVRFSTMPVATQDPIKKVSFVGMPITISGVALSSLTVLFSSFKEKGLFFSHETLMGMLSLLAFLLSYLMISRFRFPSLKALHFRYTSAQLLFCTAAVTPFLLLLLVYNFVLTCTLMSWGYILFSWSRSLYYLARGKKELALVEDDKEND